ncbi:MAG: ASCH domain-containing protein [Vicinamibacterales bacterium]
MSRRAISIRQPWVEMILRGLKKNEFRSVPTNVRGRVYIYASLRPDEREPWAWTRLRTFPDRLPVGKIVGTVEIVGCRWDRRKGWGAYALARPKRLRRPRVARNQPNPIWWIPEF